MIELIGRGYIDMKKISMIIIVLFATTGCRGVLTAGITEPVPWLGIDQADLCANYEDQIDRAKKALRGMDYDNYIAMDGHRSRIQKYRRLRREQCSDEQN